MNNIIEKILKKLIGMPISMQDNIKQLRKLGMKIGENNYIQDVIFGREGRDPIEIGDNCVLTGCTILGHDASPAVFINKLNLKNSLNKRIALQRKTIIKDKCFIGYNSTILAGVTIGPESIVGAGAVVTKNVPARTVVAGNPAKQICTINKFISKHEKYIKMHPDWYPGIVKEIK